MDPESRRPKTTSTLELYECTGPAVPSSIATAENATIWKSEPTEEAKGGLAESSNC